jgi:hypothetical protein
MLALVKHLDKDKLQPRTYVVASTDRMGAQKAQAAEQEAQASKVLCSAACRSGCLLCCIRCQPLFASDSLSDMLGESCNGAQGGKVGEVNVVTIPRSREVGQSYLTSIWTTLLAVWAALAIIYREAPQLVRSSSGSTNEQHMLRATAVLEGMVCGCDGRF